MQNYFRTSAMKLTLLGALAISSFSAQAVVSDVNFQGSTLGGFNADSPTATTSLFGLNFWNSTFNITTAGGTANPGGNPVPSTSNFNNFGSFQLTAAPQNYAGNTFTLNVIFTAPAGIAGGGSTLYTASLTGQVVNSTTGGVLFDFDNTPQSFSFSNAGQSGTFTLSVNDVPIQPSGLAAIGGTLTVTSIIPEVTAVLPLGAMLMSAGIGQAFSRRRRSQVTA